MTDFFLKLKNWQLFIIVFAPTLFFFYSLIYPTFHAEDTFPFKDIFFVIGIMGIICTIWQISIALSFFKKIYIKSGFNSFRFYVLAAYGFLFILTCFVYFIFDNPFQHIAPNWSQGVFEGLIFRPMGFFWFIASFFNTTYYNAKLIKTIELKRTASFIDCIGVFFSFCIFPLGILLIQPRINRIYNMKEEKDLINHLIE